VCTNRARVRMLDGTWATVEGSPKSGRTRTVMLDEDTVTVLATLRAAQRSASVVSLAERRDRGGHVFLSADGKPLSGKQIGCAYDRHVSAVDGLRRPGGIHSLRHTHASLLLAEGVTVTTVAKRLGDTIAVVETTYAHWIQAADERAAAAWAKAARR
jgi:integrase